MSLRPEAQSPFDRHEWFNLARARLRWGASTRVTKLCGHHFCDLTQPQCCSCIDNRPHSARYYKYVDGRGMVPEAKRWSAYCPGCQIQYGEPEDGPDAMPDVRMARDVGEVVTRCVTCEQLGHAMWECPQNLNDNSDTLPGQSRTSSAATSALAPSSSQTSPPPPPTSATSPPSRTSPTASVRIDFRRPSVSEASTTSIVNSSAAPASSSPSSPSSTRMLSPPRPVPRLTVHQQRRARIQAHFERSFGSLSDIANDPDYVSPIASLYGNAYARFQERESERRNREQTGEEPRWMSHPQFGMNRTSSPATSASQASAARLAAHTTPEQTTSRFTFGATLTPTSASPTTQQNPSTTNRPTGDRLERSPPTQPRYRTTTSISRTDENLSQNTRSVLESLRRRLEEDDRQLLSTITNNHDTPNPPSTTTSRHLPYMDPERFYQLYYPYRTAGRMAQEDPRFDWNGPSPEDLKPPRPKSPEPLSKEELTISNECKVCFSQHCDILLLPCAHLALCEVSRRSPLLFVEFAINEDSGVRRRRIPRLQLDGSTINV